MSEPESTPPPRKPLEDLAKLFGKIEVVASSQGPEVELVDTRALEGEDDLASVGETWLKQEIRHTNQIHWIRIFVLLALLVVALIWLLSVGGLLLAVGFKWKDFELSDLVLVTYMGTTTASVLGLFHIAAKWLFSAGFVDFARSIKEILPKK
jgi:hypothetical protein